MPTNLGKFSNVVKSARIYVMGDNMLTWKKAKFDGLDPEVSLNGVTGNGSTAFKTITLGLNVNF